MKFLKIIILGLLLSLFLFAAPKNRSNHKSYFGWELKLNTISSLLAQSYFDKESNYLNLVLKKSEYEVKQELQPEIHLFLKELPLRWSVKPKLKYKFAHYIFDTTVQNSHRGEYGFWENYFSVEPFNSLEFSIGIINIQWGSSELINPSQILVSEQILSWEPFQYFQGIEMVKLQWTPSQSLTFNYLAELYPFSWEHNDETSGAQREFQQRHLVRGEYATPAGDLVIGQVLARKNSDKERYNYGAYGLWSYTDWTQLYFDFILQRGSEVSYIDESSTSLNSYYESSDYLFSLGLVGHRLTFANGMEWKIEYIFNSFGKTEEERQRELSLLKTNPNSAIALAAYYQRRYIFPGQNYLYNSLRWDEPSFLSSLFSSSTIYLRNLNSLTDNSGFFQFEFQSSLSDSWSQALSLVNSYGAESGELNSELNYLAVYSVKKVF